MLQLIQFYTTVGFLLEITNSFIGDNIQLDKTSIIGYKSMGFDTSKIAQEDDGETQFSIVVDRPIPLAIYDNLFTWAKYGKIILPSSESLDGFVNRQLHSTFRKSLHDFLRIDLEGVGRHTFPKQLLEKFRKHFLSKRKK